MRPRLAREFDGLIRSFGVAEHKAADDGDWFLLPDFILPEGWELDGAPALHAPIAFRISAGYPTAEPYGFLAPNSLRFRGALPENCTENQTCPFPGTWLQFSWAPEGWFPAPDGDAGPTLSSWARSFSERLKQGR